MTRYINKDAVIAEITKRLSKRVEEIKIGDSKTRPIDGSVSVELTSLVYFLNTLEVKEVDLEEETKKWWEQHLHLNPNSQLWMDAHQSVSFAQHFFELGLNAQKED